MRDIDLIARIEVNPRIMSGQPVIHGTRLTVQFIVNQLAHGATIDELTAEYGGLTAEDVRACLLFAATSLGNVESILTTTEA